MHLLRFVLKSLLSWDMPNMSTRTREQEQSRPFGQGARIYFKLYNPCWLHHASTRISPWNEDVTLWLRPQVPQEEMSSRDAGRIVFLRHKTRCLFVAQEDTSSCVRRRRSLLGTQEERSSWVTSDISLRATGGHVFSRDEKTFACDTRRDV